MITRTQENYQVLDWESMVFPTALDAQSWTNASVDIDPYGRIHLHNQRRTMSRDAEGLMVTMQHVGSGILVTMAGKLDAATAPALREVLSWPEGTRAPKLYLHMEHVWSIDMNASDTVERVCQEQDAHIIHPSEARLRLVELIGSSP